MINIIMFIKKIYYCIKPDLRFKQDIFEDIMKDEHYNIKELSLYD